MTKPEIREIARYMGNIDHEKPSNSCLLTRFPHEMKITEEMLGKVDTAENQIRTLGFRQVRVRYVSDETVRIEIDRKEFSRLISGDIPDRITGALRKIGFRFVTLDLEGFRCGSMDEQA